MVGKGDSFRPVEDKEKFESEWDRIFSKKKKKQPIDDLKDTLVDIAKCSVTEGDK
jgi:hypothetical protein